MRFRLLFAKGWNRLRAYPFSFSNGKTFLHAAPHGRIRFGHLQMRDRFQGSRSIQGHHSPLHEQVPIT